MPTDGQNKWVLETFGSNPAEFAADSKRGSGADPLLPAIFQDNPAQIDHLLQLMNWQRQGVTQLSRGGKTVSLAAVIKEATDPMIAALGKARAELNQLRKDEIALRGDGGDKRRVQVADNAEAYAKIAATGIAQAATALGVGGGTSLAECYSSTRGALGDVWLARAVIETYNAAETARANLYITILEDVRDGCMAVATEIARKELGPLGAGAMAAAGDVLKAYDDAAEGKKLDDAYIAADVADVLVTMFMSSSAVSKLDGMLGPMVEKSLMPYFRRVTSTGWPKAFSRWFLTRNKSAALDAAVKEVLAGLPVSKEEEEATLEYLKTYLTESNASEKIVKSVVGGIEKGGNKIMQMIAVAFFREDSAKSGAAGKPKPGLQERFLGFVKYVMSGAWIEDAAIKLAVDQLIHGAVGEI